MKRFLSVSAIVLMGATAATAATEADLLKIQSIIPEATMSDLDAMGDARVASIINAIDSGDSEGDVRQAVRALYDESIPDAGTMASSDFVNESNLAIIQQHIPEATLSGLAALGDARVAAILDAISSADSESDARNAAVALYDEGMSDDMTTTMATDGFANEANLAAIQQYVPDATMAELEAAGNEKIAAIMNAISSGDASESKGEIEKLLGRQG